MMGVLVALAVLLAAGPAYAQAPAQQREPAKVLSEEELDTLCELDPENEACQDRVKKPASKIKPLKEFIEGKTHKVGLFDFYIDDETGDVFMAVRQDQFDTDLIYFSYAANGSTRGPRFFGALGDNSVFRLRSRFNRIDFIQQNTSYTFDPDSPLVRAEDRNIVSPLIASARVVARNAAGTVHVIDVTDLFSRNALVRIGGDQQGLLSKDKSSIVSVETFPSNTLILSEYVFDLPNPPSAAASSITVLVQHSFMLPPEPGFETRRADPRVGYFTERKTNLTRLEGSVTDDLIQRWRLVKKDPDAAVSDPVQPIVFWIENTTPLEYRDAIRDGTLRWNKAFEAAGFSNAIEVHIQPDDADWSPGDVRYNVLQWVSSPSPRFLGYGPRYTNPRTGEIMGADIVLEHASLRRTIGLYAIYGGGAGEGDGDDPFDPGSDALYCSVGEELNFSLAMADLASRDGMPGEGSWDKITREGVYYLALHEVGHALGLTHNMMGSYYRPPTLLSGPGAADEERLSNSVMDYPAINIAPPGRTQGRYFPTEPGPYDIWAIQYAYAPEMSDPSIMAAHMGRSGEPDLHFGNDADLMASPGRGIDPRVNVYDLSSDPIAYAGIQVDIVWALVPELRARMLKPGESHGELTRAFNVVLGILERAGIVASRYIGGVYVDRSFVGDPSAEVAPHQPVPYATQKRAMAFLVERQFAPDAFGFPPELLSALQYERRGFDLGAFMVRQDPLVHARVRAIQANAFDHLLDSRTLRRLGDTGLYGNDYSAFEMLSDLTAGIFEQDLRGDVNSMRTGLQVEYVRRLIKTYLSGHNDAASEAALLAQIESIDAMMARAARVGSGETRAHRRYIRKLIADGLDPARGG
jgi:hypothetical protein